ncbi:hypothetical protein OFB62_32655, partial [Escherichia coli]|nr:hypothetical protein [Escherichia coli]
HENFPVFFVFSEKSSLSLFNDSDYFPGRSVHSDYFAYRGIRVAVKEGINRVRTDNQNVSSLEIVHFG